MRSKHRIAPYRQRNLIGSVIRRTAFTILGSLGIACGFQAGWKISISPVSEFARELLPTHT